MKLELIQRAAEIAKSRTTDKRWLTAIDRAVAGFESWIVTELADHILVTTENGTYHANGACQCRAYTDGGKSACKHRALYRLIQIAHEIEETAPAAVSPEHDARTCEDIHCEECDRLIDEQVERDIAMHEAISLADDIATSSRENLLIEIENIWSRTQSTPLAVELMARFGKNKLEMLDDDCLRRVRLAIAM